MVHGQRNEMIDGGDCVSVSRLKPNQTAKIKTDRRTCKTNQSKKALRKMEQSSQNQKHQPPMPTDNLAGALL
jgi:hypothetical protein